MREFRGWEASPRDMREEDAEAIARRLGNTQRMASTDLVRIRFSSDGGSRGGADKDAPTTAKKVRVWKQHGMCSLESTGTAVCAAGTAECVAGRRGGCNRRQKSAARAACARGTACFEAAEGFGCPIPADAVGHEQARRGGAQHQRARQRAGGQRLRRPGQRPRGPHQGRRGRRQRAALQRWRTLRAGACTHRQRQRGGRDAARGRWRPRRAARQRPQGPGAQAASPWVLQRLYPVLACGAPRMWCTCMRAVACSSAEQMPCWSAPRKESGLHGACMIAAGGWALSSTDLNRHACAASKRDAPVSMPPL